MLLPGPLLSPAVWRESQPLSTALLSPLRVTTIQVQSFFRVRPLALPADNCDILLPVAKV